MIAVVTQGRLGNQMFQWAFATSAAYRLGTSFAIDASVLSESFSLDDRRRATRPLKAVLAVWRDGRFSRMPHLEITGDEDPQRSLTALRDGVRYEGYFQSADYFIGVEEDVRRGLTVLPMHQKSFLSKYADLVADGYTCVHVRRGDYHHFMGGVILPGRYVHDALAAIAADEPIVFISDDIAETRAVYASAYPDARFEDNDPVTDLQLLAHARNAVLSNSSFAWWGGWLDTPRRVRTVAPQHWLGLREKREWPVGVVPARWEQVPVV
jgi:hypothetical protein